MKLGNYSIFFKFTNYAAHWLKQDDESLKTNLANLYDAGSILGSILIGFSSDLFKKRSPILGSCLVFATIVSFCGFGIDKDNYKHLYYMLPILGFFLAGSCNIISSVSCTELVIIYIYIYILFLYLLGERRGSKIEFKGYVSGDWDCGWDRKCRGGHRTDSGIYTDNIIYIDQPTYQHILALSLVRNRSFCLFGDSLPLENNN